MLAYTDGYTAESTITLGSDVGASKSAGTCFSTVTAGEETTTSARGNRGVVCHVVKNAASIRKVEAAGHTLTWYSGSVWKSGNAANTNYPGTAVG